MAEAPTEQSIKSNQEILSEVDWVKIKDLFQPNTIGQHYLTSLLKPSDYERKRPKTILDEPVKWLWETKEDPVRLLSKLKEKPAFKELENKGIISMQDLLSLPSLEGFENQKEIETLIERYFRHDLQTLPHMRLLQKILRYKTPPIVTADKESSIIEKTVQAFTESEIVPNWINILEQRFGLRDGIRRTTEETAGMNGVRVQRIRNIQNKSFPRLYHAPSVRKIDQIIINHS